MVLYGFLMGGVSGFSPWILAPSEPPRSSTEFCVLKYEIFGLRLKQAININAQGYSLKLPARFIPIPFPGLTRFMEEVDFLYLWKDWHQVCHAGEFELRIQAGVCVLLPKNCVLKSWSCSCPGPALPSSIPLS